MLNEYVSDIILQCTISLAAHSVYGNTYSMKNQKALVRVRDVSQSTKSVAPIMCVSRTVAGFSCQCAFHLPQA